MKLLLTLLITTLTLVASPAFAQNVGDDRDEAMDFFDFSAVEAQEVKIFAGKPEKVETDMNAWLKENDRKIFILNESAPTAYDGGIVVIYRYVKIEKLPDVELRPKKAPEKGSPRIRPSVSEKTV